MKINTKTINLPGSMTIDEYISKRLERIERLVGDDSSVQCAIELTRTTDHHQKGDVFMAEIHIIGKGRNIYASSEKDNIHTAIDEACDEAIRSLKSGKKKYLSFVRRGGATVKSMVKGLWPWK